LDRRYWKSFKYQFILLETEFVWNDQTQVLIKYAQVLSSFTMMGKIVVLAAWKINFMISNTIGFNFHTNLSAFHASRCSVLFKPISLPN